ncbi:MAG: hypothetical protein FJ388_07780 [Verrucomicrobia bacterium]|nr:hypothetical protein [Verrucomicrobiota bacterium]
MNTPSNPAHTGSAVIVAIILSGIVSEELRGQSLWLRLVLTGIAGGLIAAAYLLIANRFKRQ